MYSTVQYNTEYNISLLRYWDSPLVSDLVRSEVVAAVTNISLFYSEPGNGNILSLAISEPPGWLELHSPAILVIELLIISEPRGWLRPQQYWPENC